MTRIGLPVLFLLWGFFPISSQTLPENKDENGISDLSEFPNVIEGTRLDVLVHSPGLENNLLGDSPDRDVSIYLPPGYEKSPNNHYAVVYFLHGFTQRNTTWWGGGTLNTDFKSILDALITNYGLIPMIVVLPNSNNLYRGSWYTNSTVTGKWEDFIIHDVVHYVDSHYRTIPAVSSRGIAGHSMGGYGTMKLGMRNPNIFCAAYALSPAYLVLEDVVLGTMKEYLMQAVQSSSFTGLSWQAQTTIAAAAAFAPDSTALPYFGQFPVTGDGELIDSVWQKWLQHDPYTMIPDYTDSLLRLGAIQFDCGTSDNLLFDANVRISQALHDHGIPHTFEEYEGNHTNKIAERTEFKLFPFFSEKLYHEVPGIIRKSSWYLDCSDTLVVEMDRDGTIYIVPENTLALPDSVIEYQIASSDASANTEVTFPLADMEYGKYFAYGVDHSNTAVSIPLPFAVDKKATPPVLTVLEDTVTKGDTLFVSSDKNGAIYLVVTGTTPEQIASQPGRIKASAEVTAGSWFEIPTADIYPKDYLLYAEDNYGFFSEPFLVCVEDVSGIINESNTRIVIFPNPVNDWLTLVTEKPKQRGIDLSSPNGQLILQTEMEGTTHQLDLSSFQKGIYFITIRSEDLVATRKIIRL